MYRRTVASIPTGLRWATAGRIEASARQIWEYEDCSNVRMSSITPQHVENQAREPDGTELTMPNDNTTRQAIFLDARREEGVHKREEGVNEERISKKLVENS